MIVTGHSEWHGPFRTGTGSVSTTTDTLRSAPYSYASRFEGAPGAIPEELLAAGHAGCFNHALANIAGKNGVVLDSVHTAAEITMSTDEHGPSIAHVHLTVDATVPGTSDEQFQQLAEGARKWCSFAKALSVPITMTATRS